MASATLTVFDEVSADDFEDRDAFIGYLVAVCGWSTPKVGLLFGLSGRQVRRIARTERLKPQPEPEPEPLTPAEAKSLLQDIALDPFVSPEDREEVRIWMTSYTQASGIDTLRRSPDAWALRNRVANRPKLHRQPAPA